MTLIDKAEAPFFFDRYINGVRMAEDVCIERETTLEGAMQAAARIAAKGPNGETPVLVYRTLPAAQPDPREAALREALAAVNAKWRSGADTPDEMRGLALAEAAILDLIDKPGHVNETPKSEHVPGDVLTPATKGGAHD